MKWGIIATGTIAGKFADTINRMEDQTLLAVGSRSDDSARAFAEKYHIPRGYGTYEALTSDPDVEAVYIATPNSMHYENCVLCLNHGKHVLCEKPFTLNPFEAEALYQLSREKKRFIMEGLWTRLLPIYAELRTRIQNGDIGDIQSVTCQYGFIAQGARKDRKFNSSLGGGALLDIGVYNLGFLQWVLGEEPTRITTLELHINDYGTDEYSRLRLKYPCGAAAESIQTIGQSLDRKATIVGTKGEIILNDFQCAQEMTINGKTVSMPFEINGFEYEIRELSRCIAAGSCQSDIYTPEDSVKLMALLYDIRNGWGMRFDRERDW